MAEEKYVAPPPYQAIQKSDDLKQCLNQYLSLIADLYQEGFRDPVTLAKVEAFGAKYSCYNHSPDINGVTIGQLADQLSQFSTMEQRHLDVCARDIWKYYRDDILEKFEKSLHHFRFNDIIDGYIAFKESIENVSPEVAKEIDELVAMSDEEFEESLEKDEEEFDRKVDQEFSDYDIPDESLYEPREDEKD